MIRPFTIPLVMLALLLSGCSNPGTFLSIVGVVKPYRDVHVRLTLGGKPVHAAHIRAVAINTGSVALPVTGEVVEEALYAWGDTAATDEAGRAMLRLYANSPHLIEVAPPPFGEMAERGPWTWTIEADGGAAVAMNDAGGSEGRPDLALVSE